MSKPRRFPLTYDEEFDADIHKVIIETPQKRRSERLRQLLRLGLSIESSHGAESGRGSAPKLPPINTVQFDNPIKPAPRVRKPLKFGPPS